MGIVMRACTLLSSALLSLTLLIGCGRDLTANDLVGTWAVTDESRLSLESRRAGGKLILKKTGEFISVGVPGELLYSMPGMTRPALVSGTGTWKLGKVDSDLVLLLTFCAINGPTELKVPNGTQMSIDNHRHETVLYFFPGDPDGGKRIDFKKLQ
jgi:hypothetical protein